MATGNFSGIAVLKPQQEMTEAVGFYSMPAWEGGMFEVRAGIPKDFARTELGFIMGFVEQRLDEATQNEMEQGEAWVLRLLMSMASALRTAAGDDN